MGLTGYSSATPNTVLLDAGVLYIGTAIIGVSRGGFKFDPGKELREFEYDGRGTAAVGDHRVTKYEAVISGKLLEITAANLLKIDAGATAATVSSVTTTTPIDAKVSMIAGGYVSDLALYVEKGDGTYRAYKFPHALCRKYTPDDRRQQRGRVRRRVRRRRGLGRRGVGCAVHDHRHQRAAGRNDRPCERADA
jgi:hypothetical protein